MCVVYVFYIAPWGLRVGDWVDERKKSAKRNYTRGQGPPFPLHIASVVLSGAKGALRVWLSRGCSSPSGTHNTKRKPVQTRMKWIKNSTMK